MNKTKTASFTAGTTTTHYTAVCKVSSVCANVRGGVISLSSLQVHSGRQHQLFYESEDSSDPENERSLSTSLSLSLSRRYVRVYSWFYLWCCMNMDVHCTETRRRTWRGKLSKARMMGMHACMRIDNCWEILRLSSISPQALVHGKTEIHMPTHPPIYLSIYAYIYRYVHNIHSYCPTMYL